MRVGKVDLECYITPFDNESIKSDMIDIFDDIVGITRFKEAVEVVEDRIENIYKEYAPEAFDQLFITGISEDRSIYVVIHEQYKGMVDEYYIELTFVNNLENLLSPQNFKLIAKNKTRYRKKINGNYRYIYMYLFKYLR